MSRIKIPADEEVPPRLLEQARVANVGIPDPILRVMSHRPDMAEAFFKFYLPVIFTGVVPYELKELVRLWIAELNQCAT